MSTESGSWTLRITLLALLGVAIGTAGHVYAQQTEPEPAAQEESEAQQDADEPDQADAQTDAQDEHADAQDEKADAQDGAQENAAADRDAGAEHDADAADDQEKDQVAADGSADEGPTDPNEFMTTDWAPDVPVNEADDAIATDPQLDPTGAGFEVVQEEMTGPASAGNARGHAQSRGRPSGDYAGPSEIPVVRLRTKPASGTPPPKGRPRGDEKDTPYSFGGKPIAPGGAPWQAQIYMSARQPENGVPKWKAQHNCGGTLIATDWVLTAAHCVDDIIEDKDAGWRVRLGARDLANDDGVTYTIDRWVRNSGYRKIGHPKPPLPLQPPPNMYSNDIALVHLKADAQTRPLSDPKRVQPIQLYRKPVPGGAEITAIGWGMTENASKSFSAVPLKVDLRVMDTAMCQSRPGYGPERISSKVICAAREGQKTCRGDSGGPVVLTNGLPAMLVGLVSWGKSDCSGDGQPSVFTRVETYLAWIDQAMKLDVTRSSLP
jgi:hypothetical protein